MQWRLIKLALLPGDAKVLKALPTASSLLAQHADLLEDALIRINKLEENQKLLFSTIIDLQSRVVQLEPKDVE